MTEKKKRKARSTLAWGGFSDGCLHVWSKRSSFYGELAVYPTRKMARESYQDVRRIEIREVSKSKRGATP